MSIVNAPVTDQTLTLLPRDSTGTSPAPPDSKEAHKNEGFLKSAWHRLTHQHDNLTDEKADDKKTEKEDEEPKRASGSG